MIALVVILSILGYMAGATAFTVYGARTAELEAITKAEYDSRAYRYVTVEPRPVDVSMVAFPAMFWPITGPFFIASGIHHRRLRAGTVKDEAQRLRATEREQLEKDNARLERELGIGGQR